MGKSSYARPVSYFFYDLLVRWRTYDRLRLVVRLVAQILVRSHKRYATYNRVRFITWSAVASHEWSHDWMRQVETGRTTEKSPDRERSFKTPATARATVVRLYMTRVWPSTIWDRSNLFAIDFDRETVYGHWDWLQDSSAMWLLGWP